MLVGVTQFKLGQFTKSAFGDVLFYKNNNRRLALDFAKKSHFKTGPVYIETANCISPG